MQKHSNHLGTESPEAADKRDAFRKSGLRLFVSRFVFISPFVLLLCPAPGLCIAQTAIKITGAVRDSLSNAPIPEAVVYLCKNRLADTTTQDSGKFKLSGIPLSTGPSDNKILRYGPTVSSNNTVRIELPEKENVTINTYSLHGRLLHSEKAEWGPGVHTIRPFRVASSVALMRIDIGNASFVSISVGRGADVFVAHNQSTPLPEASFVAKLMAVPVFTDTIVVIAAGYDQRRFAVSKQVVSGLRIKCLKTTVVTIPADTVADIDGNVYKTVKIGMQTWMTENLKTTKFSDSIEISQITDGDAWKCATTPGYCFYDNSANYGKTYGAFYNWYAVDASNIHKLAPKGWHVATDSDWVVLETYLGGWSVAGGKMKETGTAHWKAPNTGATDESGFLALPAGKRTEWTDLVNNVYLPGAYIDMGYVGWWWSSTKPTCRNIQESDCAVFNAECSAFFGAGVRCVKD
jgi:uncharacterized protein (TIGR02145 family)